MSKKSEHSNVKLLPVGDSQPMALNIEALHAAKRSLDQGAVTPSFGPWRADIVKLLNDSLATELVCVLRYKRHHFTAQGLASSKIADEFLVHANEESAHADYDDSSDLMAMIRANLIAERVAIEAYSQMIAMIGEKDSTTRRLLEDILSDEQEHAEELRDWLAD
jgi:bacterioferritin